MHCSDASSIVVILSTIYISFRLITNCNSFVYNIYFTQTYDQLQSYCLQYIFSSDVSSIVVLLSTIYISLRRSINLLQSYCLQYIFRSDVSPIVVLLSTIYISLRRITNCSPIVYNKLFRSGVSLIVILLVCKLYFVQTYIQQQPSLHAKHSSSFRRISNCSALLMDILLRSDISAIVCPLCIQYILCSNTFCNSSPPCMPTILRSCVSQIVVRGHRGRDRMVVGFTTTNAYLH